MMDSCYTDWLRESFRKIRSTQRYENCLIATYLSTIPLETLEKQKFLYQLLQLLSYIRTLESSKLIKKLRGGDFVEAATALVVIVIMWQILGVGIEGFVLPNPGWGVDRPNPFQPPGGHLRYPPVYDLFFPRRTPGCPRPGSTLQINRPTAMPHQEFTDLTKEERRQLPHHHDKIIDVEGHQRLRVGFWQSRFKVADHGAVHGLPYSVKNNGGTKTEKSDDNALSFDFLK